LNSSYVGGKKTLGRARVFRSQLGGEEGRRECVPDSRRRGRKYLWGGAGKGSGVSAKPTEEKKRRGATTTVERSNHRPSFGGENGEKKIKRGHANSAFDMKAGEGTSTVGSRWGGGASAFDAEAGCVIDGGREKTARRTAGEWGNSLIVG